MMIACKQESFPHRYIIKILSSVLIALLNVIVQLLLPRVFSIEEYGYYSYNLNVFTSIVTVFNLSASDALVSKFSKNNEEKGYVVFYLQFFALVSFVLNIGVLFLFPTSLVHNSFAGQTLCIMLLGLNAAIVRKLLTDIVAVFDAMALSRLPAFWQIVQKILITIGVVGGYFAGILHLFVFYILQIATILFVAILLVFVFFYLHKAKFNSTAKKSIFEYIGEFHVFCRPLVLATVFAQVIIIIKNWALMHWSGIASSALFGAAWQLNIVISYVFSPYAELMKREFAVIHDNRDMLRHRMQQSLKIMAWLISFLCIFIAVYASDVLTVLFGDKYTGAVLVTQLIMLYTVYQAWGQILGSFMLAVEQTKASSIISMIGNIFSVVLLYFFQCPNFIWAKGLGASGMGWSYVIGNIFSVTLMLCFIAKKINMKFVKLYVIPVISMIGCFSIAFVSYMLFRKCIPDRGMIFAVLRILCGGFLYCGILMLLMWRFPRILGIR
ncbi:lipopolysaccharide biosynthesis protein [Treponema parvum]|uniref:lipopolysaccharide biosynthesis protein n=1 Tax=Treponema parvum TaxID=138851 RepID=UPI001AEC0E89|nr:polysaccharide biosynthesis C-terminal domain-containing protein [Treponema parvum]QTQ16759.1 polysaccharide biosynthesis C-terminal domain-containing protein [Treponema parvum]